MISDWLNDVYAPKTEAELSLAVHQIAQEIALAGLYRAGFYERAAFYGGTALRIFHGLPRFSEDLDFSLLNEDKSFTLSPYLNSLSDEFEAFGMKVAFRQKARKSQIESAFLKSETLIHNLIADVDATVMNLPSKVSIKIKLEVDTMPPMGFDTEQKLLLRPFSCYINCFTMPDLFAGKTHALLFRSWKTRVKGRDWYDMEWYIKKGIELNLAHFRQRAVQSGDWPQDEPMEGKDLKLLLLSKAEAIDIKVAKEDIRRFIPNDDEVEIWSTDYFSELFSRIKIKE